MIDKFFFYFHITQTEKNNGLFWSQQLESFAELCLQVSELCRRSRKIENIVRFCKKEALGRHWRAAEKKPSGGRKGYLAREILK